MDIPIPEFTYKEIVTFKSTTHCPFVTIVLNTEVINDYGYTYHIL